MSKLYYTNPLHAAIMAEEFGVRLQVLASIDEGVALYDWIPYSPRRIFNQQMQYYIHPDSYDIFEPMHGDLGIDWDDNQCIFQKERQVFWQWYTCAGSFATLKNSTVKKIIQRDGKNFFTPERSE